MDGGALILDNSVLSAFKNAGWFRDIEFWSERYTLVTTRRVWRSEFANHHRVHRRDWLTIRGVGIDESTDTEPTISEADLSLILVAEASEDSILVTNDKILKQTADQRGCATIWGTKFLIQTFEECGITEEAFEAGLPNYFEDVPIPESVATEARSAEK